MTPALIPGTIGRDNSRMPSLSWPEIRNRATRFAREWQDATSERAEAQTFWNEFFDVFGINRRAGSP